MAFYVDPATGAYNDIDVERQIYFESPWALEIKKGDKYPDLKANEMHETVVQELTEKLQKGVVL
jgi:chromosome condensin MukBEF complex kleisin-like MukF subunit